MRPDWVRCPQSAKEIKFKLRHYPTEEWLDLFAKPPYQTRQEILREEDPCGLTLS